MIRRALLVAAAATALILTPSVAMADGASGHHDGASGHHDRDDYSAPGYGCFWTPPSFVPGHHLKFHCSHGHLKGKPERETLTITSTPASIKSKGIKIAGTKSMTATSVAGAVSFDVTFAEPGTYALALTNAAGVLRSSQTVVIHAAVASAPAASGVPSSSGGLSSKGFDGMPIALGGGVLVLLGAGTGLVARRRKSAKLPA
jgi:hypothetical protein